MGKPIIGMFLAVLFLSGCAHNISKLTNESNHEYIRRVANLCNHKNELIIETTNNDIYKAKELKITIDSTSFIETTTNHKEIKDTKEISSISFSQKCRGAYEGLLFGSLIGASAGLGIELLGQGGGGSAPKGNVYTIIYSSLAGGIIGIAYGIFEPGTIKIKVN
jgi:hypothetical protein